MIRDGFSLPELVTAMALGGLVCTALVGALSSAEQLTRQHAARVERAETFRIAEAVLAGETRFLDPTVDVRAAGEDSLVLRAFRGSGIVCARGPGSMLVRYRGVRGPEADKDSLLVREPVGGERAVALEAVERIDEGCALAGDESLYRISTEDPSRVGTLVLVFESGSYHLANAALRYRRGQSGRQPLTAELIDHRTSAFRLLPDGRALVVELVAKPASEERRGPAMRFRFGLPNGRAAGGEGDGR